MTRIFVTLCSVSTTLLVIAFGLGLMIDDPTVAGEAAQRAVTFHFLAALGGLLFACLVHAIVFTYFMGTGRWLEETSNAYRLPATYYESNRLIKYRVLPGIIGCFLLLLLAAALGAASDPGSPVQWRSWRGIPSSTIHFGAALLAVTVNLIVNYWEFAAIHQNGEAVQGVLNEVRRIRTAKGLAV